MADIVEDVPNGITIDFMINSPITREESSYWDPLHYTVEIADQLAQLIHEADTERMNNKYYQLLSPSDHSMEGNAGK